jgi:Transposase
LDVKKRFSEEQIIGFLREADGGLAIKELCRRQGFSEASDYLCNDPLKTCSGDTSPGGHYEHNDGRRNQTLDTRFLI